jgi:hypothetical protein
MRAAVAIVVVLAACGPSWKQAPHGRLFQTEAARAIVKPTPVGISEYWELGTTLVIAPLGRAISPGFYVKGIVGGRDAKDVNQFEQVPDSSWFENRIGRHRLPFDVARTGAATDGGPAAGALSIISGKLEGVSAGFVARDEAGQIWFVKMDHPAFPQLSTSAEVVASRLLWLAGYHVPSMHVLDIERSRLKLDPKARRKDGYNRSVPLTQERLDALLANTNPDAQGRIRMLFSKKPEGDVLGPFSYRGRRVDDWNDQIDHEHRRSLRGLWLFSAWVNNTDTKDANTLDVFRPTRGKRGVVDHYLIDFGDSFGATGLGEKVAVEGWTNLFDWNEVLKNFFSFGFRVPGYLEMVRSPYRSVGLFEGKKFNPEAWTPAQPNWAFDQRTEADVFWAASILARIQPEHIRAAVEAGFYSEPGAKDTIVKVLLARREKLLVYGMRGFLELDRPRLDGERLRFDDLRALGGMKALGTIKYRVYWNRTRRIDRDVARGELPPSVDGEVELDLAEIVAKARRISGFGGDPFLTVELKRFGGARLDVHLRILNDRIVPVGVDR